MSVFVLVLNNDTKVFQNKDVLARFFLEQVETFGGIDEIESANLYFGKGDYEDLQELYEEVCNVDIDVYERNIIK